ncbi:MULTISPECIES: DUF2273 domain-containing protein [Vagococcus]|uniref:DUF2273 domain-containing protein n=1 Tax=Vagococcus TaxID=2737 RepID=UPI0028901F3A|nr:MULTISPECIES: DUF2273 domain-containing protein [Vagococcus]MDT2832157.1 DUF2273 domain-containing protein [Vagococcus carniphilus]MDT2841082.1 DUF2273 domain-containing protein [Vagococcus carniphilus]MDT2855602.1 DUF2273 domain-containing protein [Vagococcus carniphilus]WNF91542.1 DUF2273 domain-containing protein [Vagococcus fluvialis]
MEDFIKSYSFPILGAIIGLILAISFFYIGFFKTIILIILMLLGTFIGYYLQKNIFLKK